MEVYYISKEFLYCESFLETTKIIDVLEMVKTFFPKQDFDWKDMLHTLCLDGAPVMLVIHLVLLP
jgi:hypothetical protein